MNRGAIGRRPWNLALTLVCCLLLRAQTEPSFEVVSVRPGAGPLKMESDPGRFTALNQGLDVLIRLAYGLREYQLEGPVWLHGTRYDIVATTSSPQPRPVQLAMLRNLLAERFRLTLHCRTKTLPVYFLVVGKNGSKLKPMEQSLPVPFELYSNFHMAPVAGGGTELRGYGNLGQLSDFLSRLVERPVVDRTGIEGAFDLRLFCAIDGFPGSDTSPSVFDALQSQLGLKLEARTSPLDITVVDHVEKPSAN